MKILKSILAYSLAGSMTACHALVTAPVLWAHGSSAAFDFNISLWVLCAIALIFAVFVSVAGD